MQDEFPEIDESAGSFLAHLKHLKQTDNPSEEGIETKLIGSISVETAKEIEEIRKRNPIYKIIYY